MFHFFRTPSNLCLTHAFCLSTKKRLRSANGKVHFKEKNDSDNKAVCGNFSDRDLRIKNQQDTDRPSPFDEDTVSAAYHA